MATSTAANIPNADAKAQYVRDKNIHHLFELLASRVLEKRPENPFAFLRDELVKIEDVETKSKTHDSSVVQFDRKPTAAANATPASSAPVAGAAPVAGPKPATPSAEPLGISIAVFGIHNAGKSALIAAMGGNPDPNTTPTIGFSPVQFNTDALNICVFDLGGGASFRGIWPHYYHDVHAVIYVVDATSSKESLEESAKVFQELVGHKYITGKPLLVFANKQDVAGAASCDEIVKTHNVAALAGAGPWIAAGCCAVSPRGDEVEKPVDWLLQTVQHKHTSLQDLIKTHTAEVKEAKAKRLAEQRARVEAARAADAAAAAAAASAPSS